MNAGGVRLRQGRRTRARLHGVRPATRARPRGPLQQLARPEHDPPRSRSTPVTGGSPRTEQHGPTRCLRARAADAPRVRGGEVDEPRTGRSYLQRRAASVSGTSAGTSSARTSGTQPATDCMRRTSPTPHLKRSTADEAVMTRLGNPDASPTTAEGSSSGMCKAGRPRISLASSHRRWMRATGL